MKKKGCLLGISLMIFNLFPLHLYAVVEKNLTAQNSFVVDSNSYANELRKEAAGFLISYYDRQRPYYKTGGYDMAMNIMKSVKDGATATKFCTDIGLEKFNDLADDQNDVRQRHFILKVQQICSKILSAA